ncbi:MAG: lysophospholipid acyltransferase family protein [Tissierellia bacterium]|nr:lysophospholipid acyltransferase family protein [Tissierellia bacterium]
MDVLIKLLTKILFKIEVYNLENFPMDDKGYIVCSNHISGWDPILLYLYLPREASFLAKKELYEKRLVANFLNNHKAIPIDRDKPELSSMRETITLLQQGKVVGIFPQGTRCESISEDQGKTGISMMSFTANAPIIPVKIDGSMRPFSRVKIFVGQPIEPIEDKALSKKEMYAEFSRKVMRKIMELGHGNLHCK